MGFSLRLLPAFAFVSVPLFCQTAELHGVVTDGSGAAVPAATVSLKGPANFTRTCVSGPEGAYRTTGLPTGSYSIQAAAPGLASPRPARIVLKAGVQTLDLPLELTTLSEQLTVRDTAAAVVSTDPANNASALVLSGEALQALSDDPTDLAADLQALAGPAAGPNGGQIYVDGFSGGGLPSKDAIREVRINQNPFSPEYDKLGLGRIEIFTKPGSDKMRGAAFYNFADDFWNSRNPYAARKAPFLLREYGGNVGGPLSRRASFFLDVRRDATDNGSIINAVTLDPGSFAITPITDVYRVPQRALRVSPRVDYQLNANNSLIVRYAFSEMDIPGAGIGSFNLASRGYDARTNAHTVQVTETAVLNSTTVHEVRFQYFRTRRQETASTAGPAVLVLGSFQGGAAQMGQATDAQTSYELQDFVSISKGTHAWRIGMRLRGQIEDSVLPENFGGTFTFGGGPGPALDAGGQPLLDAAGRPILIPLRSIEQYRRTLLFQSAGYSAAQIRSLGGGATQFSMNSGTPELSAGQYDVGVFAADDWRIRPNITLSLGLRYEGQTNIHSRGDFAPRLAVAWAPGQTGKSARGKTVLRAGFGIFYDRFGLANTLTAERYNGRVQQQYVIANPDFFPAVPPVASLANLRSTQVIQEISSTLRAPYLMQSAASIERQLPRNTTLAVTYANAHGLHMLRSRDINAPVPGTYDHSRPESGVTPFSGAGPIFLMESAGLYNQNQLIVNVNSAMNSNVSLLGSYMLNRARSNTDGLNTFPANQYDLSGEYGPAATDVHQRVLFGGSVNSRRNLRLSPLVTLESGPPFDITTAQDVYGTTLFNARPGLPTDLNKAGLIRTTYGLLDPNPSDGERIIPRNYGRGPGLIQVNLRMAKTFGFGPAVEGTARRYNLIASLSIRNVLNHNNPGAITGNLSSPLFGQANQPAGSRDTGGGGFSEAANNRRLELQMRFTF